MRISKSGAAAAAIIALGVGGMVFQAQGQASGPFTAAQASAGHAAFLESCASCHNKTLQGGGEAPALAGSAFMGSWGQRSAAELYGAIKASMPMGNANSLAPETYQQIVAFLLQANGAMPGPASRLYRRRQCQDRRLRHLARWPAGLLDAPVAAALARRRAAPSCEMGLVVTGTVKNYIARQPTRWRHPSVRE